MVKSKPKVCIVMCTYNGEAYLNEQLESLFAQTYDNYEICIKDDGSTDETLRIIEVWAAKSHKQGFPTVKILDGRKGLGYPSCFYEALQLCDIADYYAFCDQDDIWNEDKIERAVKALETEDSETFLLYYAAFDFYDANMNFLHSSYYAAKGNSRPTLREIAFGGQLSGFAMVINHKLKTYVCNQYRKRIRAAIQSKDVFIALCAASLGTVIYDSKACAKYRRHSNATTYTGTNALYEVIAKSRRLIKENFLIINTETLRYLKDSHMHELSNEDAKFCEIFASDSLGLFNRLKRTFFKERLRTNLKDELGLRVLFLIGKGQSS